MPAIRPIQLSALKALDPLDQQPQRGEDDNDQADVEHVGHGPSSDCHNPGAIPGISGDHAVLTGKWGASAGPCGTHARGTRIPNRTHAARRPGSCYHRDMQMWRMSRRDGVAMLAGVVAPLALAALLIPFRGSFPNTDAALALILVVVAVAANGYRPAGYLAAVSAAVWFDFFLTRPYEELTITRRADIETTVLLLVIGAAVTEIAVWGRRQQAAANRRAGYLDGINAAAQAAASGGSTAGLIDQISARLTELLSLRSCEFQYGKAGLGRPARLQKDGRVATERRTWDVAEGLPDESDLELLVENGGVLQGRFLMRPKPQAHPTLEQRLVAIALAEQVGAALAGAHPVDI